MYRKNSKNWDTLNYHRDCPTNGIVAFYSAILRSKDSDRITNRVDTDQTAPWGAVWSGSALFAQTYLSQYFKLLRYTCLKVLGKDKQLQKMLKIQQILHTNLAFLSAIGLIGVAWKLWERNIPWMTALTFFESRCRVNTLPTQQVHVSLWQEHPPPTSGSSRAVTWPARTEKI